MKYKDKLNFFNKDFFKNNKITIEKHNLANEILNEIKYFSNRNGKIYLGITGHVGSGKTFLLNYIINLLNVNFNVNENILHFEDICIIDDIKKNNYDISKINKSVKYIIFTFNNFEEYNIKFKFKKFLINEENNIYYLNTQNNDIVQILEKFKKYPFRILKILNEEFENDENKINWNNKKEKEVFRSQKMIEWYLKDVIKMWKEIKSDINSNYDNFPCFFDRNNKNFEKYLDYGVIYWNKDHFKWNFDEILFSLFFREWISGNNDTYSNILSNPKMYKINWYINKSNIFQNTWINYLKSKNELNLLKDQDIYATSLLFSKDVKFQFKPKIIFDLNSIRHIYIFLKYEYIKNNIDIIEIFNNCFKIFYTYQFTDEEIDDIENNFSDFDKLIIFAFLEIHDYNYKFLIENINYNNIIDNITNIEIKQLTDEGILFLEYLIIIIEENFKKIENEKFINEIDKKLLKIYEINNFNKETFILKIKEFENKDDLLFVDNLFYHCRCNDSLIKRTSRMLSEIIKKDDEKMSFYHHQLLYPFNTYIFFIFKKIKNKEYYWYLDKNINYINQINDIGFSDYLPIELTKEEFNFIQLLRDILIKKIKNALKVMY